MNISGPSYEVGDSVWHRTADSPRGIVLDAIYSLKKRTWEYIISFSANDSALQYIEEELTDVKLYE